MYRGLQLKYNFAMKDKVVLLIPVRPYNAILKRERKTICIYIKFDAAIRSCCMSDCCSIVNASPDC